MLEKFVPVTRSILNHFLNTFKHSINVDLNLKKKIKVENYSEAWAKLAFRCRKLCGRSTAPSMKQNSRPDKGNRTNRVPFHKRQPQHNLSTIFATNGNSSSVHTNQSTKTTTSYITNNPSCTTSPTTSTSTSNSIDSIVAPLSTASQRFVLNAKAKIEKKTSEPNKAILSIRFIITHMALVDKTCISK